MLSYYVSFLFTEKLMSLDEIQALASSSLRDADDDDDLDDDDIDDEDLLVWSNRRFYYCKYVSKCNEYMELV